MTNGWRVISTGFQQGAWNMAIDEALFQAVADGQAPRTLRFYGWNPPAVSLGYAQPQSDVDVDACVRNGIDLVRRPTGGRAILHHNELTYSVVVSANQIPEGNSVMASYRWISRGLLSGLRSLGVDAQMSRPDDGRYVAAIPGISHGAACFAKAARCDIVCDNKKLVGSAQVRRNATILQHGSVPIELNRGLSRKLFGKSGELQNAIGLSEIPGMKDIGFSEVEAAIRSGFEQELEGDLRDGELSEAERRVLQQLVAGKYGREAWLRRTWGTGLVTHG